LVTNCSLIPCPNSWDHLFASQTLARFGYETNYQFREESKLIDEVFKLHDILMRGAFLLKHNTIDAIKIKYFGKEPFAE
jgi:hypothetical protein